MAWSLSTGAAVTLSWWGVHTVMSGTAYDRPRALPITADNATTQGAKPQSASTRRPPSPSSPAPGTPNKSHKPSPTPSAGKPPRTQQPSSTPPSSAPSSGNVQGYTVEGGRVVFDLGEDSAELVSATPAAGWQMQVWKQPTWIRVTFTQDGREVSVFCTWNGHPPLVEFYES
jgi:hypothetical protein